MILRLVAHLSYISGKKLHFISTDSASQAKLIAHCDSGLVPYNITPNGIDFVISANHRIYDDITALIGLECIVHVKIIPFSFGSKFTHNTGKLVTGIRLILDNITATGN